MNREHDGKPYPERFLLQPFAKPVEQDAENQQRIRDQSNPLVVYLLDLGKRHGKGGNGGHDRQRDHKLGVGVWNVSLSHGGQRRL
jgi:hypothetical protein